MPLYLQANFLEVHPLAPQHISCNSLAKSDKAEQDVLCANEIMVQSAGFLLSELEHPTSPRSVVVTTLCGSLLLFGQYSGHLFKK
jgi:hypothetical protein